MQAGNSIYSDADDIPEIVSVFPLAGALLLPGGQLPLNIFEPRYLEMIDQALAKDRLIAMVQPADFGNSDTDDQLCEIGCLGRVTAFQESGDGRYMVHLTGICRFRVKEEIDSGEPFRQISILPFLEDLSEAKDIDELDRDSILDALKKFLEVHKLETDWESIDQADNETLVNALCMICPYQPAEKQALLEASSLVSRAETLITLTEMNLAGSDMNHEGTLQ